ncbi:hypothetical protein [Magnetospira sp. QH-2]|uniref:hypothetical protein n=1 Tax=Magnetospira sp. (strain QH-2) TaxID=1288970 RepID=UPI0003E81B50|nr:hypothetical protein [Magnetospira sp. QH-2]CCQ75269.1 conserved protein of unknown function [Magnetospira sp. QH-2]
MADIRRKAIVTLLIGEAYVEAFERFIRPTWQPYAERHGYDLVALTELIDPNADTAKKSLHWQKLLIGVHPALKDYDKLVWMDADILINHRLAPCIASAHIGNGIGAVTMPPPDTDFCGPDGSRSALHMVMENLRARTQNPDRNPSVFLQADHADYYRVLGLDGEAPHLINTGVLVFDPRRHGATLAGIYMKYDRDFIDFEMTPLSFEIQNQGLLDPLDPRFNTPWALHALTHYPFLFNDDLREAHPDLLSQCVNAAFRQVWFLHFAGTRNHPVSKRPLDLVDPTCPRITDLVFPDLAEKWPHWFRFVDGEGFKQACAQVDDGADIDVFY